MNRQEDFHKQAKKYANECGGNTQEKCATMTDYFAGAEHGYQYAKDIIGKLLLCIELSNFFPTLDEDEEIAKGRKKLIEFISKTMEEL